MSLCKFDRLEAESDHKGMVEGRSDFFFEEILFNIFELTAKLIDNTLNHLTIDTIQFIHPHQTHNRQFQHSKHPFDMVQVQTNRFPNRSLNRRAVKCLVYLLVLGQSSVLCLNVHKVALGERG
jgi:hypothetical protein